MARENKAGAPKGFDEGTGNSSDPERLMTVEALLEDTKRNYKHSRKLRNKVAMECIRHISKNLPEVSRKKELRKSSGQTLLEGGMKDYNGGVIDPTLFYIVYETNPVKVNQFKKLKKAYENYGVRGVFIYGLDFLGPEYWTEWRKLVSEFFKENIPKLQGEVTSEKLNAGAYIAGDE